MNRTFRSLVVAAAATAALSLVTLATASPSATASSAPHPAAGQFENNNWAGTMVRTKGSGGFHVVSAKFTVPKVTCSRSIGGGKTSTYSEVSYWVGLGGWLHADGALEQAGIAATCASKTSAPHYGAWFEMVPRNGGMVPIHLTTHETYPGAYGSTPGKAKPVKAGDSITVIVQDGGNTTSESGLDYEIDIYDWTQAVGYQSLGNLSPGIKGDDRTAEVITERTSAGLSGPLTGLAYTGSAYYTDNLVSTFADPGQYVGLSATTSFTSTRLVMTDVSGHPLIIPSALSSYGGTYGPGGHSFHTYWVAP